MKKILFFLPVLILLGAGCNYTFIKPNPVKEFVFVFTDGGMGSIQFQYKPESCDVNSQPDKAVGCTFYVVKYINPNYTCGSRPVLTFILYDKNDVSLYTNFSPSKDADEVNKIKEGWELKGSLTEDQLSQANFQEVNSIAVMYKSGCN